MARNSRPGNRPPPYQVRIIAGRWRGRKLKLIETDGLLRPTPDRVRETLFNWLQPVLEGARCLDLFAGSGALGFEALSRGAASATLVENNAALADQLRHAASVLQADAASIVRADALSWLNSQTQSFDIVFLDPPYTDGLIARVCSILIERRLLTAGAFVYTEFGQQETPDCGTELEKVKQGRAGQVQYELLKFTKRADNDQNGHLSRNL